jgi:hypothetical protein
VLDDCGFIYYGRHFRAKDKALHRLHDAAIWEKAVRSLPLVAHWLNGQPIDDRVTAMAGAGWREEPVLAPSRTELLSIVVGD